VLKEDVLTKNGDIAIYNGIELRTGVRPKFNIKKASIVYMPMNAVNEVMYTEPERKWLDIPVQAAAQMLLGKKDRIEEHMVNGTLPERCEGFECKYCHWYKDCHNTGDYDKTMPDYLIAKLRSMSTLGGGGE
jgi:hypothetical protein